MDKPKLYVLHQGKVVYTGELNLVEAMDKNNSIISDDDLGEHIYYELHLVSDSSSVKHRVMKLLRSLLFVRKTFNFSFGVNRLSEQVRSMTTSSRWTASFATISTATMIESRCSRSPRVWVHAGCLASAPQ